MIVFAGSIMGSLIALIAMSDKSETCDHRNIIRLRSAQQGGMEIIDANWIRQRLTGQRGELADLARAMGVKPDVVTKILKGERRVQPAEMLAIKSHLERSVEPPVDDITQRLLENIPKLTDQERGLLLAAAIGMIAQHPDEET